MLNSASPREASLVSSEENPRLEAPFAFADLFFSRTNKKGIIQAGNRVFQSISQYNWDELIKKPHNIIRHPDMPRGVFCLLWDFLKRDRPIAAYVKNRTKDGRYYWVMAIITSIPGGYLSVRLKPSSDLFPAVQELYKNLLSFEKEKRRESEEGMTRLLAEVEGLGFTSYEAFMSLALRKEIMAREAALGRRGKAYLARFDELAVHAQELLTEVAAIFSSFEINQYVPMNLQIRSAQLGPEGRTLGVIAGNFSLVSCEIRKSMDVFCQSARDVFARISEGQFLLCVSIMQQEMVHYFREELTQAADAASVSSSRTDEDGNGGQEEPMHDAQDMAAEVTPLEEQEGAYRLKAKSGLDRIMRQIETFQEECQQMKRHAASLEVIRVMGRVDIVRIPNVSGGLLGLIDELKPFQSAVSQALVNIEKHCAAIRYEVGAILKG